MTPSPPPSNQSPLSKMIKWTLSDNDFELWWRSLPYSDQKDFVSIYGGTIPQARFVCVYLHITNRLGSSTTPKTIAESFSISQNLPLEDRETIVLSSRAWKEPSVQFLIDKIKTHERQNAARQIEAQYTTALLDLGRLAMEATPEEIYSDDEVVRGKALLAIRMKNDQIKNLSLLADKHKDFVKMVNIEEGIEREDRFKKAVETERKKGSSQSESDLTEETLEEHLKNIAKAFGPEKAKQIMLKAINGS